MRTESTVFVVQHVSNRDLSPAKDFGKISIILSGQEDLIEAHEKLDLAFKDICPLDYVLLIGSPINIVLASHAALKKLHCVNFLQWDRDHYEYQVKTILS